MGGEWICLGVVDLLGIISFFLRVVVGVSWLWYYKSVDQESSLFLTMDSQTSSPVGPAA